MKKILLLLLPLSVASMAFAQIPLELYGVTNTGGPDDMGVLFHADESGNNFQVLRSIEKYNERASVYCTPIEPTTGLIYGMTSLGGKYDEGVIYEYEIATNGFVIRHSFSAAISGKNPNGSLLKASNGKLYGMTKSGGSAGKGVIFAYDLSTHAVQKLFDFSGTNGESPYGSLIQSSDGMLYGMTSEGGIAGKGVIFRYSIASGSFEKLVDFDGTNGAAPRGDLLEAANGKMYGFTFNGGTGNYGVTFSFDKATLTYTKLQDLTLQTRNPTGSFMQASNGLLFGLTRNLIAYNTATGTFTSFASYGEGTPSQNQYGEIYYTSKSGAGFVYQYSPYGGGGVTVVDNFTQGTQDVNFSAGTSPCNGMLLASDGLMYGVTAQGADYHGGALYTFSGWSNSLRGKVIFNVQSKIGKSSSDLVEVDKKLYGIGSGGRYNEGVIYRYDIAADSLEVMVDLNVFNDMHPSMQSVNVSFVKHPNGKLYCFYHGGPYGSGFLMEYVPGEHTYTNIYSRGSVTGLSGLVTVRMIVGQNGLLYGVTNNGGANGYGVLFSFDVTNHQYTVLHDWTISSDHPYNLEPIQLQDGKLYGIVNGSVNALPGVIYSFDIATNTYQEHVNLSTLGVSNAIGPLTEGPNGKLFASFMNWSIVEFDIATNTAQVRYTLSDGTTGAYPGKILTGTNGKLYGLSRWYQATNFYEFDPVSSAFTVKYGATATQQVSYSLYGFSKICKLIPDTVAFEVAEICPGEAFSKTSSVTGSVMTYQWMKDGSVIPGATSPTLSMNVVTSDGGYYYCHVNNGCREADIDSVQLTVLPLPIVDAGLDQYICNDSLAVLTAAGDAASYAWSGGITDNIPFIVNADRTYILTGTGANGCVNTDTVNIFISPVVDAGPDITLCISSPVTFNASGTATDYNWSDNVIDGTAFIAEETRTYVVTGTDTQGCVNTDTLVLTVLPGPTVDAGPDTTACLLSTVVFHATGDADTYVWSDNIIDGTAFIAEETHTYTVTGMNAQGCTSTDTLVLTVSPGPTVDAGTDLHICNDSLAVLTAGGDAVTYTWSGGITDNDPFTVYSNGTYILSGTDAQGCEHTDTVSIFISPAVYAGQDTSVCISSPATFHASGDAVNYAWSDNVIDGMPFLAEETRIYVVTGYDGQGCSNTDTLLLTMDSCLIVWPGDTDNDYEVGTQDFFNIGLNFGASGQPRNTITNDWLPQTSDLWSSVMTAGSGAGLNHAYADCNGDGTIDFNDTLAVQQNFALVHALKPGTVPAGHLDEYGKIFFTSSSQAYGANQLVTIDIHAGTQDQALEQLYGLAFDVHYSASGIVPGSLSVRMNDQSWIGQIAVDAIRLGVNDGNGNAHLALCRTDHSNVSSYGVIGKVSFLTSTADGTVTLTASDAMQISADGVVRDLQSEGYSVAIDPLLAVADIAKLIECRIYPNPSKGVFQISGLHPEAAYTLVIRDNTGKLVHTSEIAHQSQAQVCVALSTGSYLLEITDGNAVYREQIVLSH